MNRHRAVALRLAGLAARDRRWLLGRLPAAERLRVAAELPAALRLSAADPDQCARWLRQLAQDRRAEATDVTQECLDTIDCAPADTVARVLGELPRPLQAEVLRLRPWRWKLGYVEQLSETERRDLVRLTTAAGVKPAVRRALLGHVAEALRDDRPERRPFDAWLQPAGSPPAAV